MINKSQVNFQNLRKILSERTQSVVIWCGAGLSLEASLPGWSKLKQLLLVDAVQEFPNNEDEILKKIEAIKMQSNLWVSFSMLKDLLGRSDYEALIKKHLDKHVRAPKIYNLLWELSPRGINTVNVDRFVATSYSAVHPGARVNEFEGFSIKENFRLLRSPDRFIVNMHGSIDKPSTWVFTKEELGGLQNTDGYREFLISVFASNTVVFVGVGADDVAVGGVLNELVESRNIDLENHYWITDRTDVETRTWCDLSHLNQIKYPTGQHEQVYQFIESIVRYISRDDEAAPVISRTAGATAVSHDELRGVTANVAREKLNGAVLGLLDKSSEDGYKQYFEFLEEFDFEVHQAWFVGAKPPNDRLFEYTIEKPIGKGAFGTVYEASKDGSKYAIKVLHSDIRYDHDKFKSFRRGVRSLHHLENRKVGGIVKMFDATEIPAMIVMEFIEGPNLKTLVESKLCDDWHMILKVSGVLIKAILEAHGVPERILHRDLKPTNVFLKEYPSGNNDQVVITDFDFSWHIDSLEGDLPRNPTGYLAPEQCEVSSKVGTRSSLVDSYSIGMLLYFMVSRQDPTFLAHRMNDWEEKVLVACKGLKSENWRSLPARYFRLIINLTQHNQRNRLDLSQALLEVERLSILTEQPNADYVELLAEELMYRIVDSEDYRFLNSTFEHSFASGISAKTTFSEVQKRVHLTFQFLPVGSESHKNIKKYLPEKYERIKAKLLSMSWKLKSTSSGNQGMLIEAEIEAGTLFSRLDEVTKELRELRNLFDFM